MLLKSALTISPHLQIIENNAKALVYDSISGHKLIVNNDSLTVIKMLMQGKTTSEILAEYDAPGLKDLIEALIKNQLIFTQPQTEAYAFKNIPRDHLINSGSLLQHLRLNVTESCNLDCTYCYEKESKVFTRRRTMSWEIARKGIDLFLQTTKKHSHKSISIRFFGGEPLLNWPLVSKCINYIRELQADAPKIKFTLNTNGTLLTDEIIKLLAGNNVYIALSLDGVEKENDKFRKFKGGKGIFTVLDQKIRLLCQYKARFGISVVFYDQNLPHLIKLIDYIKNKQDELKYNFNINLSPLARIDRQDMDNLKAQDKVSYFIQTIKYAKQQDVHCFGGLSHFPFNKLLSGVQGTFCGGAGAEFSIDPDGNIFPCSGLDMKLGHLDTFTQIFSSSVYNKIAARRTGNLPHCQGCQIEGFCSGGCLADVQYASGDIYGICRDCEFQRELFKELVKEYILPDKI